MANMEIIPTLFEYQLSDITDGNKTVSKQLAETIMQLFAAQPLFTWAKNNNGCEARADVVCAVTAMEYYALQNGGVLRKIIKESPGWLKIKLELSCCRIAAGYGSWRNCLLYY